MIDDRQALLDLVKQVLESTTPFMSAWEFEPYEGPDGVQMWHRLREVLDRFGVEVVGPWEKS